MRREVVLLILVSVISINTGCGRNEAVPKESPVLARINKYELTTEDFDDEAKLVASNKYFSGDPTEVKEKLLDEMIVKKILLEEAQRQNFDKDRAFMKEIERYWEQALLKLLMKKKMEELSRNIVVKDSEVREEYARMSKESGGEIAPLEAKASEIKDDIYNRKMQALLDEWLRELRAKADVKIYKENL